MWNVRLARLYRLQLLADYAKISLEKHLEQPAEHTYSVRESQWHDSVWRLEQPGPSPKAKTWRDRWQGRSWATVPQSHKNPYFSSSRQPLKALHEPCLFLWNCYLLSLLTDTETSKSNNWATLWASSGPVKLTHIINHHDIFSPDNFLDVLQSLQIIFPK